MAGEGKPYRIEPGAGGLTHDDALEPTDVTCGTVTGLIDLLVSEDFVMWEEHTGDRWALVVRLTPECVLHFEKMAAEHEEWLSGKFAGLRQPEHEELSRFLGRMRSVTAEE